MTKKKKVPTKKPTKKSTEKRYPVVFSESTGDHDPVERTREERLREQCAALGVLGRATIAELERQDRRDWEINRRDENEPMISDPVWHVHHKR